MKFPHDEIAQLIAFIFMIALILLVALLIN